MSVKYIMSLNKLYQWKPVWQIDWRLTKIDFNSEDIYEIVNNVGKTLYGNNIEFGREFNFLENKISLYLDERKWDLVENFLLAFN